MATNERDCVGGRGSEQADCGRSVDAVQQLRKTAVRTESGKEPAHGGMANPRPQIPPPAGDAPVTCLGCNLLMIPERCVERGGVVVCDVCEGV